MINVYEQARRYAEFCKERGIKPIVYKSDKSVSGDFKLALYRYGAFSIKDCRIHNDDNHHKGLSVELKRAIKSGLFEGKTKDL